MATEKDYSISASAVNAVVESAEKIEGAASLLLLLEEKARDDGTVASPELAAIRSILESCAKDLMMRSKKFKCSTEQPKPS